MELTKYSRNLFMETMARWEVPQDYADPIYNYLVHGFSPGSFFTAVLANNFMAAVQHSHPGNTIPALKNLVGWIESCCPGEAWGDHNTVTAWINQTTEYRRQVLESQELIYPAHEEIVMALKNEHTVEPFLW